MKIPDEAVEAARTAYMAYPHTRGIGSSSSAFRAALEAAAPHLAAQTLREASAAYPLETAYGGAEHAVQWLKDRPKPLKP